MSNRPPIPEAMKRKVRQEAYFGCVKCGCPIIEYHHIEPWSKVKKHEAKNLVALCPNCHREATVGAYYEERVIEDKKNPINKKTGLVQNQIMLRKFDDIVVKLGGAEISKTQNILTVFGARILYFNIDKNGRALLNAVFFDQNMQLIAVIQDNEWRAFLDKDLWDMRYSPGHLVINLEARKIFLNLKVKGNTINIRMKCNVFGNKVEVTEEKLQINGCSMVNCRLIGGGIGIG